MTPGQTRVVVLLLVLLALEALRMPGLRSFIHNGWAQFNTGLSQGSKPS